ncbi:hypothetical protein AMTRI_Chr13g118810 [Amborella trichopoda]
MYPGVWTTYSLILFFSWLIVLSIFVCSISMAWTIVNLSHFAVIPYDYSLYPGFLSSVFTEFV